MTSAIAQLWTSSNYSFKLLGYRNSLPQKQPFYYAVSGSAHKAPTYSSRCVSGIPMYRSLQSQQRSDQLGSAQRTRYHSEDLELPFHEMSRCKSPSVYHYLILRLFCLSVASTVQGSSSMNLTTSPTSTPFFAKVSSRLSNPPTPTSSAAKWTVRNYPTASSSAGATGKGAQSRKR